jgi:TRAP-type C4-dicarboxylate transport system permease small subunit
MMEISLIVILALLAVSALFVWWRFDIDLSDIVASSVTPATGIGLIYVYRTPLAWAGGLLLIAIGIFALLYLLRRRERLAARHGHYRDES